MIGVDVMGVMDRAVVFAERTGSAEDLANFREARAAVAELIEADKAFDFERDGYNPLYASREWLDLYKAAEDRRAAALARVTGAAA